MWCGGRAVAPRPPPGRVAPRRDRRLTVCLSVLAFPRGALPRGACQRARRIDPPVLPLAQSAPARPSAPSTIGRLRSGASCARRHRSAQRPLGWRGRCAARLARLRAAVPGGAALAARATRPPWSARSIRRHGVAGLVGIPPCASPRRFGGVLRIQASSRAPVRVRAASPLARWRHMPAVTAQALPLAPTREPRKSDAHGWHLGRSRPVATRARRPAEPWYGVVGVCALPRTS